MSVRFRVVFALACAVLAAMLCTVYAQHVQAETERERSEALERYGGETVNLVVATKNLSSGETVTKDEVTTKEWLSDLAPEGAKTDIDEVVGKRLTSAVASGSPLCSLAFEEPEGTAQVPDGHVALSLSSADRLGLPDGAATGARLLAYRMSDSGTSLISDDVRLLATGSEGQRYGSSSITLAVLPSQVADILAASASGNLRLVVPADDVDVQATGAATAPTSVAPTAQEGNPS